MCSNCEGDDFFSSLGISGDSDLAEMRTAKGTARKVEKVTYPCERCGGKGKYMKHYGSKGFLPVTCPGCNGKGSFTTPKPVRDANRAKAQARKAGKVKEGLDALEADHPGLLRFLANATWSTFAQDLTAKALQYGGLTEGQLTAANKMRATCEAKAAAKALAPDAVVSVARIEEMFDRAQQSGKNQPMLYVGELKLYPAPEGGRNSGGIYIKASGEYCGKIVDGKLFLRNAPEGTADLIERIAANPFGVLKDISTRTTRCCCCGRKLTNPVSVAEGIGPICRDNWGI